MAAAGSVPLDAGFFERLARSPSSQDPHAVLESLRRIPPPRLRTGELVLTRHRDVVEVLRDPRFVKPNLPRVPLRSVRTLFRMFLLLNAPDHERLRRAVAPLFAPTAVARRRERIADVAESLLGKSTTIDVIREFAYPLPLILISEWLGVREGDESKIARWSATLTQALDAPMPLTPAAVPRLLRALTTNPARPAATLHAARAIVAYARTRLAGGCVHPAAEFLAALRSARDEGVMSFDEAVATWVLIVIAGHETTANLIGNAVYLLLHHPDQLQMVNRDASLVPAAIEETLRYESPVPMSMRVATANLNLAETRVTSGTAVILLLGAANRDPDFVSSPNRFDIRRDARGHVAFGHGSHFCIGAQLARIEAEVAIGVLLRRTPQLSGDAPSTWRDSFATRGLSALTVQTNASALP